MTDIQILITAAVIAAATMLTRFAAFIIFPKNKPLPKIINYLGKVLPGAMMGFLLVYCLKDIDVKSAPFGIPELLCVGIVFVLTKYTKNTLISIGVSTLIYIALQYTVV